MIGRPNCSPSPRQVLKAWSLNRLNTNSGSHPPIKKPCSSLFSPPLDLYLIWEIIRGVFWEFVFTFRWVIAFRFFFLPFSFFFVSSRGNKHRAWSNSRENMNPKNNKRVLFNFFKPHLPIKAEQTYPATCERLLSSVFHRKTGSLSKGAGGLMGLMKTSPLLK